MSKIPKISIVIPTYNIEKYIEKTIRSIIDQDYPNLEIIIMDGKSTDGTLRILEKFKYYFSIFISEEDQGQYDAINKGFAHATGDIFAYLNGDDIYYPWTLNMVSKIFSENVSVKWISGVSTIMSEDGIIHGFSFNTPSKPKKYIQNGWFRGNLFGYMQQEGMFWSRELWLSSGGFNLDYKLAADYNLWINFSKYSDIVSVGIPLACFRARFDSRSKAYEKEYLTEVGKISARLPSPNFLIRLLSKHLLFNRFVRKITYKKGYTYKYYRLKRSWQLKRTIDSISQHTLSTLIQELCS